ncbi:hypothetical protein HMPREF9123_1335 [Neisseria bacilliformis ATCC BAA-1200]|uniref:Uncharacterized protein n=1 Tax=Neisseria bacilliformis ATCC BAA-1200 TaxID=888742 RepID=F2BCA7_9NEIS|nr:hypothetical protein HMPREF9123_1335 [Neisseria bacilliformis ATCC BAA-1200]
MSYSKPFRAAPFSDGLPHTAGAADRKSPISRLWLRRIMPFLPVWGIIRKKFYTNLKSF